MLMLVFRSAVGYVGPILAQREAYGDLGCSCQTGDAYIDLSIHLFDTYFTRSKEMQLAAQP